MTAQTPTTVAKAARKRGSVPAVVAKANGKKETAPVVATANVAKAKPKSDAKAKMVELFDQVIAESRALESGTKTETKPKSGYTRVDRKSGKTLAFVHFAGPRGVRVYVPNGHDYDKILVSDSASFKKAMSAIKARFTAVA